MDVPSLKRKAADMPSSTALVVKKPRVENAIVSMPQKPSVARTSSLQAPIMQLSGHGAPVNAVKFSGDGRSIVSCSDDKQIFLWEVREDCKNYGVLKGHKNAVIDTCWSADSRRVFSASADKTGGVWDVEHMKRDRKLGEHSSYVSAVAAASKNDDFCVTCSDDGTAKLWDLRQRAAAVTVPNEYPLTAVEVSADAQTLYTGGVANVVTVWDLRKTTTLFTLVGHQDTITCLRLDPTGSSLLTNAMDDTLKVWDVRSFAPSQRCMKTLIGASHNFEKVLVKCNWSHDGSLIASGSSDSMVYIWDSVSRDLLYKLPGHKGTVTEVSFHPTEPIIASSSNDRNIFLGEINPIE